MALVFMITILYVFFKIHRKNPSLLKPALIKDENIDNSETTYEWNLIANIFIICLTFAVGIGIVSNLIIFMFTDKWYINSESTFVIIIIFIIFTLREFDKFVTKLFKNSH